MFPSRLLRGRTRFYHQRGAQETSTGGGSTNCNRIGGWTYDGRGNIQSGANMQRAFSYDGENRQTTATINSFLTTYAYDGDGKRITRTSSGAMTTYVYDAFNNLAAEYGGQNPSVGTNFLSVDHLGSTRLVTNAAGAVVQCHDYMPFGDEAVSGVDGRGSCFPSALSAGIEFTSKERDSETGLDYFLARYYSAAQGRFTSPDEFKGGFLDAYSGKAAFQAGPLPYADISDPQTLNKYGYVRNNPLRYTDPDGHCSSFLDCAQSVIAYVKDVGYVKVEGGVGIGVGFRAGPIKASLDAKKVSELSFSGEGNTKKIVGELGVKGEIGPVKTGLEVTTETVVAKGNQIVTNGETETKVIVGSDAGAAKQSGWNFGIGASAAVGVAFGVEVGVNGQKVLSDIKSVVSTPPPPSPPPPPPPPKCTPESGCN